MPALTSVRAPARGAPRAMNDARLHGVPLVLETPKDDAGREDVRNLTTLVGLVEGAA
jgi:hypothetical protein